jgi:hypothetical protein
MGLLACLIVAPQQGYDEPGIVSYAIRPFCPTSADGLQSIVTFLWLMSTSVAASYADYCVLKTTQTMRAFAIPEGLLVGNVLCYGYPAQWRPAAASQVP